MTYGLCAHPVTKSNRFIIISDDKATLKLISKPAYPKEKCTLTHLVLKMADVCRIHVFKELYLAETQLSSASFGFTMLAPFLKAHVSAGPCWLCW